MDPTHCQPGEESIGPPDPIPLSPDLADSLAAPILDRPLECQVYNSFAALQPLRAQWDPFVAATGSEVYQSFDWCRVWWDSYGRGQLRVFVFRRRPGGELAAILPMFLQQLGLGPVRLKVAKMVGSDSTFGLMTPPVQGPYAQPVFGHLLTALLDEAQCDVVSLGPLSGTFRGLDGLRRAAAGAGRQLQEMPLGSHAIFQLPSSVEEYLASLNKRQRENLERRCRLLEKQGPVSIQVVSDQRQILAEFDAFRAQHDALWAAEGKLGHFRDWPGADAFHRKLLAVHGPLGRAYLLKLVCQDHVIAYEYGYRFGDGFYALVGSRRMGKPWDHMSLGRVSMLRLIQWAIGQGARWIESGPGHYPHKIELGAREYPLLALRVVGSSRQSRVKLGLFVSLWKLLHLAYYRVFFLRVAPRLPLIRKPLWRLWIVTRV